MAGAPEFNLGRRRRALLRHGSRGGLVLLLAIATHVLFPNAPVPDLPVLDRGMVAERDIIARVDFPVYKSDRELRREQDEAAASVAPAFVYSPQALDTMKARVRGFLARIDSAASSPDSAAQRVRRVAQSHGVSVSDELVTLLQSAQMRSLLLHSLEAVIHEDLSAGVAAAAEIAEAGTTDVRLRTGRQERSVRRDSLRTAGWLFERAVQRLPSQAPSGSAELQRLLLIRFFEPSIRLDRATTTAARERARQAISPIRDQIVTGEKIIGAHEQVQDDALERLRAYQDRLVALEIDQQGVTGAVRSIGSILLNLLILLILGGFIFATRPQVYDDFRHLLVLFGLGILVMAAAAATVRAELPVQAVPIALGALLIAALWDRPLALVYALAIALLLAVQAPFNGLTALAVIATAGAAAALSVRAVERRIQAWKYIAIIAAAYAITAIALGLLNSQPAAETAVATLWGIGNAIVVAGVAMGLLPLLEIFTRITTDQTLLELSDLNRPLLRRLAVEAPGTFAHVMSVANLASVAARGIGAHALLTRVGAYYHDVGKILAAQYFVENQRTAENPHNRLEPLESAAILRAHVTEGERLAQRYRLPRPVVQFIREHHGTQAMAFFLDRARTNGQVEPALLQDFYYSGPKPQSRETALVMLADSVESAARVLDDPTPERIRELVDRIVDGKIAQGQLDETPLSLRDISRVKAEFTTVLMGVHHRRIAYPDHAAEGSPSTP